MPTTTKGALLIGAEKPNAGREERPETAPISGDTGEPSLNLFSRSILPHCAPLVHHGLKQHFKAQER